MIAWVIVFRNLSRHKLRASLSFLAVFFAATLFHLYVGAHQAIEDLFGGSALHHTMWVKPRRGGLWETTLPASYQEDIRKLPGVLAATTMNSPFGLLGEGQEIALVGVDPVAFRAVAGSDLDAIPAEAYARFAADPNAALLSRGVRLTHGLQVGQHVEIPLRETTDVSTIPGYEAPKNPVFRGELVAEIARGVYSDRILIVHLSTVLRELNVQRGTGVLVLYAGDIDADELGERVEREFDGREQVEAVITENWASSLHTFLDQLSSMVLAIIGFVGLLAIGVLSHSVSMASYELRPQIAALRALGTSRLATLFVLTGEGIIVSLAGAAAASSMLWLVSAETSIIDLKVLDPTLAPAFAMSVAGLGKVFGVAVLIVLLGAVLPSLVVTRTPIAELLRRND